MQLKYHHSLAADIMNALVVDGLYKVISASIQSGVVGGHSSTSGSGE
jgi:hypothetical protein